jgi:hypothetical protein
MCGDIPKSVVANASTANDAQCSGNSAAFMEVKNR